MSIRTINYTVTSGGISPNTEQQAGIQSEHAATSLIFTIDSALYQSLNDEKGITDTNVYRFDCFDSVGGVMRTEAQPLSNRTVSLTLGENLTRNGGKAKVYLVISRFNAEFKTEVELLSYPAKLRFENLPEASENSVESAESISTLTEVAKEAANKASESAAEAEISARKADTATQAAENAVEKANTATQAAENAVRESNETLAKTEKKLSEHNTSDSAHEDIREDIIEKIKSALEDVGFKDGVLSIDTIISKYLNSPSGEDLILGSHMGILLDSQDILIGSERTTGNFTLTGRKIELRSSDDFVSPIQFSNIAAPTDNYDAVNKQYVNNLIGDIDTALENIITLQQDYIRGESV